MNDKLKQRLAGAAVLLVATFVVVSLLPTPEQAAHPGDVEIVTIPLHDVVSAPPPSTTDAVVPSTLAAPAPAEGGTVASAAGDGGVPADDGVDEGGEAGSSGDDDAVDEPPPEARKPVRLALEPALKPEPPHAPADTAATTVAAAPAAKPETAPKPASTPAKPVVTPAPVTTVKPVVPATLPAAPSAPAPAQRWYVQVGGFADIDNARKVQANLKSAAQPNLLAPVETGKGTIYRVRAGPYASEAAAQQALDKVKALGYPGSQLVKP